MNRLPQNSHINVMVFPCYLFRNKKSVFPNAAASLNLLCDGDVMCQHCSLTPLDKFKGQAVEVTFSAPADSGSPVSRHVPEPGTPLHQIHYFHHASPK